jgi:RNA ligase (TIGR02306 family)
MSTFTCPLVQIPGHGKHKNADSLRITQIEGSTCIFKEGAFDTGHLAVFIPVDALVPLDHRAFSWLKDKQRPNRTHHRVKALRLRGVFSDGFLVPLTDVFAMVEHVAGGIRGFVDGVELPFFAKLGEDFSTFLGVTKFEEEILPNMGGKAESYGPDVPVYDIEPLKRFKHVFDDPTEQVVVTCKIHGTNSRFLFKDDRLWVGSRNRFLYMDEKNLWWNIATAYGLEEKLKQIPDHVLYGETYGDVQDLRYGCEKGKRLFAAFDIYDVQARKYLDYPAFKSMCERLDIPMVPVVYTGPYTSFEHIDSFVNPADEDGAPVMSAVDPNTIREGVVVKPVAERWNHYTHRTIVKLISRAYLLRKGGTEAH